MSDILYGLTEEERSLLLRVWNQLGLVRKNVPSRSVEQTVGTSPEVYIMEATEDIDPVDSDDIPSSGVCQVKKVVSDGSGGYILAEVAGFEVEVYNPTAQTISSGTIFPAVRDKYGSWLAIVGGGTLDVIGPCATYTPPIELPDTNFNLDFGGGCLGPDRYGLNVVNLGTLVNSVQALEFNGTGTSTIGFSTDVFSHGCQVGSLSVYAVCVFNSLDRDGVTLTIYNNADDSVLVVYTNRIHAWNPIAGGNLELAQGYCDCSTFPYYVCLSVPTR